LAIGAVVAEFKYARAVYLLQKHWTASDSALQEQSVGCDSSSNITDVITQIQGVVRR